jgi:hypothetical protein
VIDNAASDTAEADIGRDQLVTDSQATVGEFDKSIVGRSVHDAVGSLNSVSGTKSQTKSLGSVQS